MFLLFNLYFKVHNRIIENHGNVLHINLSKECLQRGPSLSAQILNQKSAFSPAIVVFEKEDYYQSTANWLFSLP